jgi:hypothetical protein
MALAQPSGHRDRPETAPAPIEAEIASLREENRQLRELVIQLSNMVIRNAIERR